MPVSSQPLAPCARLVHPLNMIWDYMYAVESHSAFLAGC